MKILGINDGFSSGVTLIQDGQVVAQVSEERFLRKKNCGGVPELSLQWLLSRWEGLKGLRCLGLAWRSQPFRDTSECSGGKHKAFGLLAKWAPPLVSSGGLISFSVERSARKRRGLADVRPAIESRSPIFSGLPVHIYDHHLCHAASSLYASGMPSRVDQALVVTMDGSGDGECFTVWRWKGAGLEKLASQNSYHSLGILVESVTRYMGMKPLEHEYKVMGMAPYGGGRQGDAAVALFRSYFALDPSGLLPINRMGAWGDTMVERLEKDFRGIRFDAICYGIQQVFCELVLELIFNWVRKTGIRNVCVGGGCFMNVKLNMALAQDERIGEFYALPSCGDESLSLGAAYLAQEEVAPGSSRPLTHLYLGPENSEPEILAALRKAEDQVAWEKQGDIELATAKLLKEFKIVGRVRGRMEWGARALGNRSILCNPTKLQEVHRLNKAVKLRDFWMPFCPSMLPDAAERYLVNPRRRAAPHMILAFATQGAAREEIPACLHPYDLTCRPQVVTQEQNPRFYRLLEAFKGMTGVGTLLNTSFNLHGLPMVNDAQDALHVLLNSNLDFLALEDYMVWRKQPSTRAATP